MKSVQRKARRLSGKKEDQDLQSPKGIPSSEAKKMKKREKKPENSYDDVQISSPVAVVHTTGINQNLEWQGTDPLSLFQLEKKLGEGAFGIVWMVSVKGRKDGMNLAVKHIPLKEGTDTEEIENEINILKQCKSEYIVSYFGVYKKDNYLWILMDYCELGSVLDMMEKTESVLSENAALWVIRSTCYGLQYLHNLGILHRDVKAGNLLVTKTADLKVADFGVSQSLSETILGDIAGSPLWMAPEVCQRKDVNHKADIWSLGVTAIELAQGDPPLSEHSALKVMLLIPKNAPPTIADQASVSKEYHDMVAVMLVKDRDQRPDTGALLQLPCLANASKNFFLKAVKDVMSFQSEDAKMSTYQGDLMSISEAQNHFSPKKPEVSPMKNHVPLDDSNTATSADGEEDAYSTTIQNMRTTRVDSTAFSTTKAGLDEADAYSTVAGSNRATAVPSFMAHIKKQEDDAFSTTIITNSAGKNSNSNSPSAYSTTIITQKDNSSIPRRSPNLNDSNDQPKLKKRENQRNLAALVVSDDVSMVDLDEESGPKQVSLGSPIQNRMNTSPLRGAHAMPVAMESPVAQTSNSTVLNRKKQFEALANANPVTRSNEQARLLNGNGEANVSINGDEEKSACACCASCTLF